MKKLHFLILLFSAGILFSCDDDINHPMVSTDQLIGHWVNPEYVDSFWVYTKSTELKADDYGFTFKAGKSFVERKNAGWCGTPPITYGDFDGIWNVNDSTINITVEYWGGEADYQWKVISINNKNLKIYKLKEDYKMKGNP
jgi:hypothetical protein